MSGRPTCESCRFFKVHVKDGGDHYGACHQAAPIVVREGDLGLWPLVNAGDWCGEHEPKEILVEPTQDTTEHQDNTKTPQPSTPRPSPFDGRMPPGVMFEDVFNGRLLLAQDPGQAWDGWLLKWHPDGHWYSWRKATPEDLKTLLVAPPAQINTEGA